MRYWGKYVPVAQRRAKAERQLNKLRKQGKAVEPVAIDGRCIARTFWGKGWCDHLESFSDYANRLPRGRTYVRNGSVCHLEIGPGRIEALVIGSALYQVTIHIRPLVSDKWVAIKKKCAGRIGSMLELLQGKMSDQVMAVVTDRTKGLFPQPGEIELDCSCPDWALMCKHVAAVLYAVGNRLDSRPELLFDLRAVDAQELIGAPMALPATVTDTGGDTIVTEQLAEIFGIDIDTGIAAAANPAAPAMKAGQPIVKRRPRNEKTVKQVPAAKVPRPPSKAPRTPVTAPPPPVPESARRPPSRPANACAMKPPTGKGLARLRKQLGLTVAQFAATLGVSPPTIYRWESTAGKLKLQQRPLEALEAIRLKNMKK
jgi:uncharacterized Zn finger protein/DNA-binding XRE family transcriptional regulator